MAAGCTQVYDYESASEDHKTGKEKCYSGGHKEKTEKGITLSQHADFLLYLAPNGCSEALRDIMISHLIDSLQELTPSDSFLLACEKTNNIIASQLEQLPKIDSTLKKKFCVGKKFGSLP